MNMEAREERVKREGMKEITIPKRIVVLFMCLIKA